MDDHRLHLAGPSFDPSLTLEELKKLKTLVHERWMVYFNYRNSLLPDERKEMEALGELADKLTVQVELANGQA